MGITDNDTRSLFDAKMEHPFERERLRSSLGAAMGPGAIWSRLSDMTATGRPYRETLLGTMYGTGDAYQPPVEVDVVIEVPRGSFLKRGSTGQIDFVSPFPCPFNYGSVPTHLGLEGDLLDAVVLGPRLAAGTNLKTRAWDAITLTDRGMFDDKLICSEVPLDPAKRARFFASSSSTPSARDSSTSGAVDRDAMPARAGVERAELCLALGPAARLGLARRSNSEGLIFLEEESEALCC